MEAKTMSLSTMEPGTMNDTSDSTLRVALGAMILWAIAAFGAHLANQGFADPFVQFGGRLLVIALSGHLLGRVGGTITPGVEFAVGLAWAALAIGTEIFLNAHGMQGWYELLGSPLTNAEWMRGATIIAWFVAPKLAAGEPG
jgi:hypothetical protein